MTNASIQKEIINFSKSVDDARAALQDLSDEIGSEDSNEERMEKLEACNDLVQEAIDKLSEATECLDKARDEL